MHQTPASLRAVYDPGDTVLLIDTANQPFARQLQRLFHTVVRDSGRETVVIRLSGEIEVPRSAVAFHENRPAYMEPDYVKCG